MTARSRTLVVAAVTTALALQGGLAVNAQAPAPAKPATPAAATPSPAPKAAVGQPRRFASAAEAVQVFVSAVRAGNTEALVGILGRDSRALVVSGDPVLDRQAREHFLADYDTAHSLVAYGETTVLHVGRDDWPFPIPMVKDGNHWRFDARRGRDEILARRIGRNELYTIQTCLAYVDAQREYYTQDRNGDGILEYAKQIASTPGAHDGLYWPTKPGERQSPLGELVVRARAEGYRRETAGHAPYHGYYYRILTAQGPGAPDGAYDYVVRGHMLAGFALVAFPAQYGNSGVMTFLVNHDGIVYQKDLGPRTREIAMAMRAFDPDQTWTKTETPEITATNAVKP